ncbi:uncharacterized protein YbjT (DUF2867 family) [Kribbella sp. VKM Ac-2527]|uniref:Uncharacterized protein YbjT (DUF2867 family) n=1 Tax=Kribbella caucasensis TaxID=2512215 RepID=A0A4R6J6M4_9ACTN|nr:NAD(P)H-binding protein [Kribbella sp. VKM Ac-2527]TDO30737.1 uncharacterized protein YbjT (DUF2867 family) [Kribbella sp. VKM Ac-2527]
MIVVTGATGNVGRELVRRLIEAGESVTAVARHVTAVPDGVRALAADLTDPDSLRPALDGADALFLMLPGDVLGARDGVSKVVDLARLSGVRRVVLLTSQSAASRPESAGHGQRVLEFEEDVRRSGMEWTIVRPGGIASNAFAWAESIRTGRTMAAPFAEVGLPLVDPDDIAAVAAAVLREPAAHQGRIYELTGPELVNPRQIAAAIGAALGEPVEFVEQTREQARAQMLTFMPEPVVDGTLAILGEPNERELRISPDVEDVLGRRPNPFSAWAERNVVAFR